MGIVRHITVGNGGVGDEEFVEVFRFIDEGNGRFRFESGIFRYKFRARISMERRTRRLVVRCSRVGRLELVWKTKKGLI